MREREREREREKKRECFSCFSFSLTDREKREEKREKKQCPSYRNLLVLLCSEAASCPADSSSKSSAACDAATTAGETELENK